MFVRLLLKFNCGVYSRACGVARHPLCSCVCVCERCECTAATIWMHFLVIRAVTSIIYRNKLQPNRHTQHIRLLAHSHTHFLDYIIRNAPESIAYSFGIVFLFSSPRIFYNDYSLFRRTFLSAFGWRFSHSVCACVHVCVPSPLYSECKHVYAAMEVFELCSWKAKHVHALLLVCVWTSAIVCICRLGSVGMKGPVFFQRYNLVVCYYMSSLILNVNHCICHCSMSSEKI